jgi:hypothetical protein
VSPDGGGFEVTGSHTYARHTSYPITITLTDSGAATAIAHSTAVVDHTALQGTASSLNVTAGENFSGIVATFNDPESYADPAHYQAVITWPDNSTTTGTISGSNPFTVSGSYSFASLAGPSTIQVVITDQDTPGRTLTLLGTVTEAPTSPSPDPTPPQPPPDPAPQQSPLAPAPAPRPRDYVDHLYLDLLGRPADDAGRAAWNALLQQGVSPATVAAGILGSLEHRQLVVRHLYATLLHRDADAFGLDTFSTFLGQGGTPEQVAALIIDSPEYGHLHGDTDAGFLAGLYQDLLGRAPDALGLTTFGSALSGGTLRSAVAAAVFASPEYQQDLLESWYRTYLHRSADPLGLTAFTQALAGGQSDDAVLALILGSAEYYG